MPISNPGGEPIPFIKVESRNIVAASGNVSYTGYGFKPKALVIIAKESAYDGVSIGSSEPATASQCAWMKPTNIVGGFPNIIFLTSTYQKAVISSYDADGFTLTWTKVSECAPGTITMQVFAFK